MDDSILKSAGSSILRNEQLSLRHNPVPEAHKQPGLKNNSQAKIWRIPSGNDLPRAEGSDRKSILPKYSIQIKSLRIFITALRQ